MRIAFVLAVLAACGGGGNDAPPPEPPVNPNPAPATEPVATIDMAGSWRVQSANVIAGNAPSPEPLTVNAIIFVQSAGGLNCFASSITTLLGTSSLSQQSVEATTGFPLDWYQNVGDGSFLDYGYGWDRLRVAGGGGGQFLDYVQYGVRVIAVSQDILVGYEAEWTQDFLGQPRFEWLAQVVLSRS